MSSEIMTLLTDIKKGLDSAARIFDELPEVVKVSDETKDWYLQFLYVYTEKALRFANGAYYSSYHDYPIGGVGAARSVYEICVAIQYVNKAPTERVKEFVRKRTEKPRKWSDNKIETMAKKIKKDDYKSVYRSLSHMSHIGAMLMDDCIAKVDKNGIEINSKLPSEVYCIQVLSAMCSSLNQIFQVFRKTFRIQPAPSSSVGETRVYKPSKPLIWTNELLKYAREYICNQLLGTIKSLPRQEAEYLVFLHIHMCLALDLAYGACHSCAHGWPIGGIGAARSIYEICLNTMYIKSKENKTVRNERIERFMMSVSEARNDTMIWSIGKENLQQMCEEKKRENGNQYKAYKTKYEKATPPYEKNKWAGISIKQMAQEVGWEQTYIDVYEKLSHISHVSEITISNENIEQTRREIHFDSNLDQNDEHLLDVLDVIFDYIPLILDEYMEAFMEPLEIQKIKQVIQNIQSGYREDREEVSTL